MFAHKTPWIILLIFWMAGSAWWHVCHIKQLCPNDPFAASTTIGSTPASTEPDADPSGTSGTSMPGTTSGLSIADGDRFQLALPGNFSFAKSGANANLNALGGSLDALVKYLKANPDRRMTITGYYTNAEETPPSFTNMGLARAEGIRQYLVQQGVRAASLVTKGQLTGAMASGILTPTPNGDSLLGGLSFTFADNEPTPPVDVTASAPVSESVSSTALVTVPDGTSENDLAKAEKFKSVFQPIDLYFPLNEANYIKTEDTKKFFDEAVKYLADHKDKKLRLTGHTDNSGADEVNLRLSRDRANEVKSKLRKSGIDPDQISVEAKGESQPKADNATLAGRRANRRVTVVVQ